LTAANIIQISIGHIGARRYFAAAIRGLLKESARKEHFLFGFDDPARQCSSPL